MNIMGEIQVFNGWNKRIPISSNPLGSVLIEIFRYYSITGNNIVYAHLLITERWSL